MPDLAAPPARIRGPQGALIISGSSGLIGSALIDRIGERYWEMGFDREGPPHPPPETDHVIDCDLSREESVKAALAEVQRLGHQRITSVVHLAAYYDFSGKPSPLYDEVTVRGTQRLLHGLKDFEVEQFIFTSTMLVHAPCHPGQRIDEDWPLEPKWGYPQSKVETEELLLRERGNIPVVFLRIAGVYDDLGHSIPIAHQVQRIYERRITSRVFPGQLDHGQSFIHLEDLVAALEKVIERRNSLPPVTKLLIGEAETVSYGDLQEIISRELHGNSGFTLRIPKPIARMGARLQEFVPGQDPFIKPWMIEIADDHYALNIDRARELLDWEPRHSLRRELPEILRRFRKDPHGWYQENKLDASHLPEPGHSWPHLATGFLGLWLVGSAPALGPWVARETASDVISGLAVLVLSALAMRRPWAAWANAIVGIWVMFAPLLLETANAAFFNSGALIGTLIIAFSVVIPALLKDAKSPQGGTPPGWTYNPSSWPQRLGIVFLAVVGFLIARYMAAFQMGHITHAWDPFFGNGTRRVLTSDISKAFPVSDAGLGALSYLLDGIAGVLGGRRRWRTMPWMVILFGLFIIPPGIVSIVLVVLQPVGVGAWCSLCLFAAVIMLMMVPPAIDEVIATGQHLRRSHREGKGLWKTFWGLEGSTAEEEVPEPRRSSFRELIHGIEIFSAPWNLLFCSLIGVWLMAAPSVFGATALAADCIHIAGALVATIAVVAMAEPVRMTRYLNVVIAVGIIAVPWIVEGGPTPFRISTSLTGILLTALSLPRGQITDRYGDWKFGTR